jgi:hypothetical protein
MWHRCEIDLRRGSRLWICGEATRALLLFKRGSTCGARQQDIGRRRTPSSSPTRLRARGRRRRRQAGPGWQRHRERREGQGGFNFGRLGRPVCDAREGSWVRGLLKPNGPNAEEGSSRPSGQKLRKEKASISFSFSNIPIAFSNGF